VYKLGTALRRTGNLEEASRLFAEAAQIWRVAYGDNHSNVVLVLVEHADVLHALGRFDEAAPLYRRLIELAHAAGTSADAFGPLRLRLAYCEAHVAATPPDPGPARA